ncbi:katanin p80 WD40 repeat-containing subunit B1 homolog [Phalaenopsis equestris]|uniref:katanin p80 WD40 repeat-containing subunit B1 homolog n=1 Tax=Phalaenopsis equestris TaxID=78828 RepID=UPI0009E5CAC9|nr:katanin p80 WD40 repeat-containing subunit B1 homolog [Phalaenopsis equestris]
MTTKRAYKLQEFVAHASNVNCLKIGRRTSRVLVTGGEDHKVNLWAIGKPNAILSLSGHTSAVESVSFDSSEVLVAAGAASGTIKLWDLEEAKIIRTLTGHRSNCISVDFHPFGEFFASGSLDTNLKIWDIRRKGCIHTYKGHTRGVNAIRFTPDGRWVVSGGEDNIVKLWDLTAGRLLHDFKCHEGQIQCIDFHPHEFLLATGSSDKTVKFWDLETFESIGSAGPETSGIRSMTFNPDGRTLLCGLQESLKVFSWEPLRCHDSVDVGWSKLLDMNVHDGKLLGCSYNQSCVGVWVVDISRLEPYEVASIAKSSSQSDSKSSSSSTSPFQQTDNSMKASVGRLSISQNSDALAKETKLVTSTGNVLGTSQKPVLNAGAKMATVNSSTNTTSTPGGVSLKRSIPKGNSTIGMQTNNKTDVVPVIVPRTSARQEQVAEPRKEIGAERKEPVIESKKETVAERKELVTESRKEPVIESRKETVAERKELLTESKKEVAGVKTVTYNIQSKTTDSRRPLTSRDTSDRVNIPIHSGLLGSRNGDDGITDQDLLTAANGVNHPSTNTERRVDAVRSIGNVKLRDNQSVEPSTSYQHETYDIRVHKSRDSSSLEMPRGARTRTLVQNWERRDGSSGFEGPPRCNSSDSFLSGMNGSYTMRVRPPTVGNETVSASDEDAIADLLDHHGEFIDTAQSRLRKLQVLQQLWRRKDVKGLLSALGKMSDYAVSSDFISILMGKSDIITLELCTCLLPLLSCLLDSKIDRHLDISLEMLLKLVKTFGSVINSTLSACSSVGVDLQAEQRLDRCNICFVELEKVKQSLLPLTRRGGSIAKSAQELNLALQQVSH